MVTKINISLRKELLESADRAAREGHASRSAFIAQAIDGDENASAGRFRWRKMVQRPGRGQCPGGQNTVDGTYARRPPRNRPRPLLSRDKQRPGPQIIRFHGANSGGHNLAL
ncbi:MAG: ribbon-helix-helix protein, CopG family [Chloroflexi bacterium]|nr:ribbon-helix-helix protein, CopG family [Chloroflexota bacterium]